MDADACPVKNEVYKVAKRYGLQVTLVSDSWFRVPTEPWIHLEVVKETGDLDAADDWIVEQVGPEDIVVSEDIILASRCLERKARVADLREAGTITGGPAPFGKADRSLFLQRLDEIINQVRRGQ